MSDGNAAREEYDDLCSGTATPDPVPVPGSENYAVDGAGTKVSLVDYYRLRRLYEIVKNAFAQRGDDVCYRDIYNREVADLVGAEFDPRLLPKQQHTRNCDHFYDCLAADAPYGAPAPVDPRAIVTLLSGMLDADPTATHALLCNRVPCNDAMVNHPTVIVDSLGGGGRYVVGLLGALNGLCYAGGYVVAMQFSEGEKGEELGLTGFQVRKVEAVKPEADDGQG